MDITRLGKTSRYAGVSVRQYTSSLVHVDCNLQTGSIRLIARCIQKSLSYVQTYMPDTWQCQVHATCNIHMSGTGGGRSADLVRLYRHPAEVCYHPAGRGDVYRPDASSQAGHLISPA